MIIYTYLGAHYEHSENMLGALRNPPKVVTVRGNSLVIAISFSVNKASGLRNTYLEGKKRNFRSLIITDNRSKR